MGNFGLLSNKKKLLPKYMYMQLVAMLYKFSIVNSRINKKQNIQFDNHIEKVYA